MRFGWNIYHSAQAEIRERAFFFLCFEGSYMYLLVTTIWTFGLSAFFVCFSFVCFSVWIRFCFTDSPISFYFILSSFCAFLLKSLIRDSFSFLLLLFWTEFFWNVSKDARTFFCKHYIRKQISILVSSFHSSTSYLHFFRFHFRSFPSLLWARQFSLKWFGGHACIRQK